MAASQRPASLVTLGEPSGAAGLGDRSRPGTWSRPRTTRSAPRNLRTMAKRAKAKIIEVKGASHVVMVSQPKETGRR